MKQFGKNVLAMLLLALLLCLGGAIVSFVFSLLSTLSLGWLIVVSLLFGFIIIGLCFGLMGSAMSYPIKLLNHSKSGIIMCTLSCLYSIVYNIMSTIDMVNEYNSMNQIGQTQFLILQIISCAIIVCSIIYCIKIIWSETEKKNDNTTNASNNNTAKVLTKSYNTIHSQLAKLETKEVLSLKHLNPLLTITDHSWSNISLFDAEENVIAKTINLGLWTEEEKDHYFEENYDIQSVSREISKSVRWKINCESKIGCDIEFSFKYTYKDDFFYLDGISFIYHASNLIEERTRLIDVLSKRFRIIGSVEEEPCVFEPPLGNIYVAISDNNVKVVVFVPLQMAGLMQ